MYVYENNLLYINRKSTYSKRWKANLKNENLTNTFKYNFTMCQCAKPRIQEGAGSISATF